MLIPTSDLNERAVNIRLVLADVDGVLTDGGVYYGADGEVMKRFNIRDGMGVERLNNADVEVGLITGEKSPSVTARAEKLHIGIVYLFCKDKANVIHEIVEKHGYALEEIAYIGDDVNDLEAMNLVGLAGAPSDAFIEAREAAGYVCRARGGYGAFREFAELIVEAKKQREEGVEKSFGFQ